jgi:hypothetical protein
MKAMDRFNAGSLTNDHGGVFRILMLSEDEVSTQRALHLYNRLVSRLSSDFRFVGRRWLFEELEQESIRQTLAGEAEKADMILLAMRGDRLLPNLVCHWLETATLGRPGPATALVALMETLEKPETTILHDYLRTVANRGNLDLFIHSIRPDDPSLEAMGVPRVFSYAASRHPGTPAWPPVTGSTQRWGINE